MTMQGRMRKVRTVLIYGEVKADALCGSALLKQGVRYIEGSERQQERQRSQWKSLGSEVH